MNLRKNYKRREDCHCERENGLVSHEAGQDDLQSVHVVEMN